MARKKKKIEISTIVLLGAAGTVLLGAAGSLTAFLARKHLLKWRMKPQPQTLVLENAPPDADIVIAPEVELQERSMY